MSSVIKVKKTSKYTVMSNYHLRDKKLSFKAKGMLSTILSLPEDWSYSVKGLITLSKDGSDSVKSILKELEENGYLVRTRDRDEQGRLGVMIYTFYEEPQLGEGVPTEENLNQELGEGTPTEGTPTEGKPTQANPNQLSKDITNIKNKLNTEGNNAHTREKPANILSLKNIRKDLSEKKDSGTTTKNNVDDFVKLAEHILRRRVNGLELEMINHWAKDFDFSPNLVELAFRENAFRTALSLKHVDDTLTKWKAKGIETEEAAFEFCRYEHEQNIKNYKKRKSGTVSTWRTGAEAGIVCEKNTPINEEISEAEDPNIPEDILSMFGD